MSEVTIFYSLTGSARKYALDNFNNTIEVFMDSYIPKWKYGQMFIGGYYQQKDQRVKYHVEDIDFDKYDVVNIVSPFWAGKIAAPIASFINDNRSKLEGKQVNFYVISGSGSDKYSNYYQNEKFNTTFTSIKQSDL